MKIYSNRPDDSYNFSCRWKDAGDFKVKSQGHTDRLMLLSCPGKDVAVIRIDPYIDGLVQDCSNSNALAMESLQSCTKPSISTGFSNNHDDTNILKPGIWNKSFHLYVENCEMCFSAIFLQYEK